MVRENGSRCPRIGIQIDILCFAEHLELFGTLRSEKSLGTTFLGHKRDNKCQKGDTFHKSFIINLKFICNIFSTEVNVSFRLLFESTALSPFQDHGGFIL